MAIDPLLEAVTPKTNWYVVIRRLQGDGRFHERGEVVDTTGWRRVDALVANRYITPLPHGAKVPSENSDGVRMLVVEEESKPAPKPAPTPPKPVAEKPAEPVKKAVKKAPAKATKKAAKKRAAKKD